MKKLIFSALAMAVMAGCTKENSVAETPSENELRISSSIQTRTIGDTWESGDEIGVFMGTTDDDDIYDFADLGANVPYTTIYGDGNFTSDSPLFLPSEGSVYILAYYPYYEGLENNNNYYPVNTTDQSDLGAIDILVAKTYNIESSSDVVDMTFSHRLSYLSFTISAGNDMTAEDLEGLEVVISGLRAEASVTVFGSIISVDSDLVDFALNTSSSGTLAEAVVIPQTPDEYPILYFKTKAGDTYTTVLTTTTFYPSGSKFSYNVTLNKGGVQLSSPTINTWGDGTEGESNLNADLVEE